MELLIILLFHFIKSAEKTKIDLVIEMEKMESVHTVLEGLIMDAALKAIDNLLNKVSSKVSSNKKNFYYGRMCAQLCMHEVVHI